MLLLFHCAETRKEVTDSFDQTEREIMHTHRRPAPELSDAGGVDASQADSDISI